MEAFAPGKSAQTIEFLRRYEFDDRKMFLRRLQILANCENVDAYFPSVVHSLFDLLLGFAEAGHDRGLGESLRGA